MKYAIALAGGGTKGSYQIGVWKALREMGIEIEAVAGTSIGAINGAAIVIDEYEKAKKLWENLDYSMVFDYSKLNENHDFHEKYASIKEQVKGIARKRGLDITPLRNMLEENISEDKVRNSEIELIIVTVSLSEFRPVYANAKEIPKGQIIDYILASAALPIFQRIMIDGKIYLDGGAYDVFPINTLIERGYKNIIAIDMVGGFRYVRRVKKNNADIIYVKNSSTVGGLLEFDPRLARKNVRMGYLDAMKAFGKNYGSRYFIKDSRKIKLTYPLTEIEMKEVFNHLSGKEKGVVTSIIKKQLFRNLRKYTTGSLKDSNTLIAAAEIAAETFEIDRIREYSCEALVKKIMKTHKAIMTGKASTKGKSRVDRLKLNLSRMLIKNKEFPSAILLMTLPKIFITNMFIYIIKRRMDQH